MHQENVKSWKKENTKIMAQEVQTKIITGNEYWNICRLVQLSRIQYLSQGMKINIKIITIHTHIFRDI
jgi:hypothetical protein